VPAVRYKRGGKIRERHKKDDVCCRESMLTSTNKEAFTVFQSTVVGVYRVSVQSQMIIGARLNLCLYVEKEPPFVWALASLPDSAFKQIGTEIRSGTSWGVSYARVCVCVLVRVSFRCIFNCSSSNDPDCLVLRL